MIWSLSGVGQLQIRVTDFIDQIGSSNATTFSYNRSLVEQLLIPNKTCNDLKTCLQLLEDAAWLTAEKQSDGSYLLIPIRQSFNFQLFEEETDESVEMIRMSVNQSQIVYRFPEEGNYTVREVYLTDSLHFYSRFFDSKNQTIQQIITNKNRVTLSPNEIELDEVVVQDYVSRGIEINLKHHGIDIDMNALGILAGETDGDILNVLKQIPGIRTPDGKPGNLNFRGSSFDQNLIFLDGIPIYHPGHFFGSISPYNPSVINQIKVIRSTLPVEWGGRTGGLINLSSQSAAALDSAKYELFASTVSSSLKAEFPIVKGKTESILAFRSRTQGEWLSPKLEAFQLLNFQGSNIDPSQNGQGRLETFDFDFQDMTARVTHRFHDDHEISIAGLYINNDFLSRSVNPAMQSTEVQQVGLNNWGGTLTHRLALSDHSELNSSLTAAVFELDEQILTEEVNRRPQEQSTNHKVEDLSGQISFNRKLNERGEFQLGYQFNQHELSTGRGDVPRPQIEKAQLHSFYGKYTHNFHNRLLIETGLRIEHYDLKKTTILDPRIHLTFCVTDHLFLKGAIGRSHQYLRQFQRSDFNDFRIRNQIWRLIREDESLMFGDQVMLGLLYDKHGWQLDLELYHKKLEGLIRQINGMEDQYGSSTVNGMDIFALKRWNLFELSGSYSLSLIKEDYDLMATSFFDQRHLFNTSARTTFGPWSAAISWSYLSGLPVEIPENSDIDIAFEGRFPAQHQLDLSILHRLWYVRNVHRLEIGLSILNLYDRKNLINVFQNSPREDQPFRYAVGIAPNFSIKIKL